MKYPLLLGVLFASLLLLGCTAGAGVNTTANVNTNTGTNTGTNTQTNTNAQASASAQASTNAQASVNAQASASVGAGVDLSDVTYGALFESGLPVSCDTTVTDAETGTVSNSKVNFRKVDGEMNMHAYTTLTGVENANGRYEVITNGNTFYTKLDTTMTGGVATDCAWISLTVDSESETTTETTGSAPDANDFQSPDVRYTCTAGVFTDLEFTPTGKVCNMDEYLSALMASTNAGASANANAQANSNTG